jgi:hypothetical protein
MTYRCTYPAPIKVWYQTWNGKWATREWRPGEKAAYERNVLGR